MTWRVNSPDKLELEANKLLRKAGAIWPKSYTSATMFSESALSDRMSTRIFSYEVTASLLEDFGVGRRIPSHALVSYLNDFFRRDRTPPPLRHTFINTVIKNIPLNVTARQLGLYKETLRRWHLATLRRLRRYHLKHGLWLECYIEDLARFGPPKPSASAIPLPPRVGTGRRPSFTYKQPR